jgi:hypothetical protein
MSHRSTAQRGIDDRAFPLRVKLRIPPNGLGNLLTDALAWLRVEVGRGDFVQHGAETLGGDATAIYFRRPGDLTRFLEAFPTLELADGTTSRGYTSPLFPRGRAPDG